MKTTLLGFRNKKINKKPKGRLTCLLCASNLSSYDPGESCDCSQSSDVEERTCGLVGGRKERSEEGEKKERMKRWKERTMKDRREGRAEGIREGRRYK